MKCHPVRWIWGLIPIAMLSWIAVHVEADRIERDLEQRAHSALAAAGFEWASVAFSGRDGILVGTPERLSEQSEALALVRNLWGVRTVGARTGFVEERPVAAPGSRGQPQIEPDTTLKSADVVLLPEMRPTSVTAAKPALDRARADDEGAPPDAQKSQDRRTAVLATAALPPAISLPDETCSAAVRAASVSDPVRFARGQARLNRSSRAVLDLLAAAANACPSAKLTIAGHTDARGPARRNLSLSQRRARVVVSYLIKRGIDAGRLEAVGYGETRPVAPNDTAEDRAKNRRIEIEVTGFRPDQDGASAGQGAGNGLSDR
jgi:outer membrane protein OmpA-like peptidoglycan-associated protein